MVTPLKIASIPSVTIHLKFETEKEEKEVKNCMKNDLFLPFYLAQQRICKNEINGYLKLYLFKNIARVLNLITRYTVSFYICSTK